MCTMSQFETHPLYRVRYKGKRSPILELTSVRRPTVQSWSRLGSQPADDIGLVMIMNQAEAAILSVLS